MPYAYGSRPLNRSGKAPRSSQNVAPLEGDIKSGATTTHDTQPETVLIAADRAMYNAKHEGKNRVAYSTTARTGTYQALTMHTDRPNRLS